MIRRGFRIINAATGIYFRQERREREDGEDGGGGSRGMRDTEMRSGALYEGLGIALLFACCYLR